jgi:hypothetical protein
MDGKTKDSIERPNNHTNILLSNKIHYHFFQKQKQKTVMLGDLANWLERVRDMPREMIELEIEDSLNERLETMQETANGFEESNDARAKALRV